MKVSELMQRLGTLDPNAEIYAHWEGWVAAPINANDFWKTENGTILLDCNKNHEKLSRDVPPVKVLGGYLIEPA